jgi:hypothetical protein
MQSKFTLRMEKELIKKAKRVALRLNPNVKSLYGSLAGRNVDESD